MRTQIPITGISTSSSYADGDCISLVNLRKKNGVLKPVSPRKIIKTLTQAYDYLFQHNLPQTGINLIGIRAGNIYWIGTTQTSIDQITDTETLLSDTTGFKSITQTGNVLNVLDSNGLKYLIWNNSSYNLILGNIDVSLNLKVDGINNANNQIIRIYKSDAKFEYSDLTSADSTESRKTRLDLTSSLFKKAIGIECRDGRLTGYVMACIAIELYDGSFILPSQPFLLGQAYDSNTRYSAISVDGTTLNYETNKGVFYGGIDAYATTNIIDNYTELSSGNSAVYKSMGNSANYIDSPIMPNLISSFTKRIITDTHYSVPICVCVSSNELKFKVNSLINEKYRSVIKSISVFITNQVQQYKFDTISIVSQIESTGIFSAGFTQYFENMTGSLKTNTEIIEELSANQQFYKVHEIPFDDIVEGSTSLTKIIPGDWITIDLKGKLGDSLVMQEELPVDNFTHHSFIPNGQMVYNSKLHIWDYKQELFNGWKITDFYNEVGIGQFPSIVYTHSSPVDLLYYIEVSIKTDTGISKVVMSSIADVGWSDLSSMLSYPDSRATSMTIYQYANDYSGTEKMNKKISVKLTSSVNQNFAYYISPDLKPILFSLSDTFDNKESIPVESNQTIIYRNSLKVSKINNPFYFPDATTMNVGTGIILNAGTNAIRMSEGQFGQYDLYIFTSEGIYSLDTGTTLSYNRISPSSLEIPIKEIICSTPFGVIFVGKRGLFIINGQQVDFLTPQLEQEPLTFELNLPTVQDVPNIAFIKTWNYYFRDYLTRITEILYDNQQNEIIIVNPTIKYNYVYNIDSKEFYQQTEVIDKIVDGVYPDLYATENGAIITVVDVAEHTIYPQIGDAVSGGILAHILISTDAEYNAAIKKGYVITGELSSANWDYAMANVPIGYVLPNPNQARNIFLGGITFINNTFWTNEVDPIDVTLANYFDIALQSYQTDLKTALYNYVGIKVVDLAGTVIPTTYKDISVNIIKDFGQIRMTEDIIPIQVKAKVSVLTRPFNFSTQDTKKLERTILRARLHNTNNMIAMNLYSNDGINFEPAQGKTYDQGNYRDIDLGLMARNKNKQFIYAFSAELDEESQISLLDCEVSPEYKNEKMR